MRSPAVLRGSHLLLFASRKNPVVSSLPSRPRRTARAPQPTRKLFSTTVTSSPGSPQEDPNSADDAPDPAEENQEKSKLRRTRVAVVNAKEPDPVQLPNGLDILSSPNPEQEPPDISTLPPPENLEDALNKLLITLHPKTQHRAAFASPLGSPTEPTLGLYCPIEGGDYVIDATVQELARRTGAEVLVLDAVHLAAGEWGQFGPAANALSLSKNPLHFPSASLLAPKPSSSRAAVPDEGEDFDFPMFPPPKMTLAVIPTLTPQGRAMVSSPPRRPTSPSRVKIFFDALINTPSRTDVLIPSSKSRPRLVYIRDFTTLAASSSSWFPPLLSAVRERRRGPISRPSSPVSNPMTIIFGMTPSLIPPTPPHSSSGNGLLNMLMNRSASAHLPTEPKNEKADWGEDELSEKAREKRFRDRLKKWESGDAALIEELPKLSTADDHNESNQRPEVVFIGSNGLPGFPGADPLSGISHNTQSNLPFFRTSVLVPRQRSITKEKATRVSRRREVNELTMRMGIGAAGGVMDEESAILVHSTDTTGHGDSDKPSQASSSQMWDNWGNKITAWSSVRRIADRAIGTTIASTHIPNLSSRPTLEPTVVPWSAVHDAWAAHRSGKELRTTWLKEAFSAHRSASELERTDEASQSAEQGERYDEVVDRVMNDADLDSHEQRLLGCIVDPALMPTSFDQVHLPPHTIDSVRTIVSLPLLHPMAFRQGILKQHVMTGCLLFGPPGTGKTLVVRALAKEAGCRMLAISPSDVMDMYVGEGEKLVKAVFSLARKLSPCVIFLDEIDALFGARMSTRESGGAFAHRGVITEFMQEMDGLRSSKENSTIVIGATNRPFDLDDAVLRRLPRRLLVDLPGVNEREEILKILLRDEALADDLDIHHLATQTESFSGSDLKHLCVSAALDAIKENVSLPWSTSSVSVKAISTTPPKSIQNVFASPPTSETVAPLDAVDSQKPLSSSNSPSDEQLQSPSSADIPTPAPSPSIESSSEQHTRVLRSHNFVKALKEITPSSSESFGSLAELRKWNDEFGEGRRDKRRQQYWGKGEFGFTDRRDKESGEVEPSKLDTSIAQNDRAID